MSRDERNGPDRPAVKQESQDDDKGQNIRDVPPAMSLSQSDEQADTTQELAQVESSTDGIDSNAEQEMPLEFWDELRAKAAQQTDDAQDLRQIPAHQAQDSLRPEVTQSESAAEEADAAPLGTTQTNIQPSPALPAQRQLQLTSLQAAKDWQNPRIPVGVPEDDDVDEVDADARTWVHRILDAYDAQWRNEVDTSTTSGSTDISEEAKKEEWSRVQREGFEETKSALQQTDGTKLQQSKAWLLFGEVINVHRFGHTVIGKKKINKVDHDIKCSDRLKTVIALLEDITRVRAHLISTSTPMDLGFIAACPTHCRKQRISDIWSNLGKKVRSRKRSSAAANLQDDADGEDNDAERSEPQTPVSAGSGYPPHPPWHQPSSRRASTAAGRPSNLESATQTTSVGEEGDEAVGERVSAPGPGITSKIKYEGAGTEQEPIDLESRKIKTEGTEEEPIGLGD